MFLLAAISLGFFGSFHCIGMCGPIALAIPVYNQNKFHKTASIIFYNAGRVFTYATLGLLFGLVGQGFALAGLQQILSVTMGVLILLALLLPQHIVSKYTFTQKAFKIVGMVKAGLAKQLAKKGFASLFVLGTLNGLLPCGLVYMAIAAALASSSLLNAVLFMAFFGLATMPLMFSISYFSNLISLQFRSSIRKAMPYITAVMATLLIVRGLNLNIPYLSPQKNAETNSFAACTHTKMPAHAAKLCIGK
jgi:hypothetical protein